jgi:hypothetical protein
MFFLEKEGSELNNRYSFLKKKLENLEKDLWHKKLVLFRMFAIQICLPICK